MIKYFFDIKNWDVNRTFIWGLYSGGIVYQIFFNTNFKNIPHEDYLLLLVIFIYWIYFIPPIFKHIKENPDLKDIVYNANWIMILICLATIYVK
jgi:hypothetical protein